MGFKGLTLALCEVVFFTDELIFIDHVKLFARRELLSTYHTCEAVEMEYFTTSSPHQITR